jgi:hypothetical protein
MIRVSINTQMYRDDIKGFRAHVAEVEQESHSSLFLFLCDPSMFRGGAGSPS